MTKSEGSGTIRLVSGLPLRKESSFIRQLRLLRRTLLDMGMPTEVSGPPFEDLYLPDGGTLAGIPGGLVQADGDGGSRKALDRARILLGYPDQFHFVTPTNQEVSTTPSFLWTQLSRTPKRSELGFYRLVRPVALTERTWSFLAGSVSRFYEGGIPIIPHGVDTALFRPAEGSVLEENVRAMRERYRLEGAFVVGTVAANSFRKRFDRMLESFAIFRKRVRTTEPLRFVVKTDRVRALDGRDLSELAKRLGLGAEVVFIEEDMSEAELVSLFGCFDVYLNLSEWEGFCIPVIEAMACGVPVVSHDVQGPGELLPYAELMVPGSVRNTEEGVLLLDASPDQAAKVLERVHRDKALRRSASEIGRRTCLELYDIRRVAESWLELLSEASIAGGER